MGANRNISSPFLRAASSLAGASKGARQAVQRAKSTLARRLVPEATRDIAEQYALSKARIRDGLSARSNEEGVDLIATGRGVGLVNFGAKQDADGVSVTVMRGTGRTNLGGSFIAQGKFGGPQVFDRKIVGGKRAPRLPLETRYGPSVAQMLRKGDREERLGDFAQTLLATEIDRQLKLT